MRNMATKQKTVIRMLILFQLFFTFNFGKLENCLVKKKANNFAIQWKIALKNRPKIIKSSQVVEILFSVRLLFAFQSLIYSFYFLLIESTVLTYAVWKHLNFFICLFLTNDKIWITIKLKPVDCRLSMNVLMIDTNNFRPLWMLINESISESFSLNHSLGSHSHRFIWFTCSFWRLVY